MHQLTIANPEETMETRHPADATSPDQLTYGQRLTRNLFPSMAAAQDARLCIQCHKPQPDQSSWSEAGRREWKISGMCEPCFDRVFADSEPDPDPDPAVTRKAVFDQCRLLVENGYDADPWDPRVVASFLYKDCHEFDYVLPAELIAHIQAWLDECDGQAAEATADR